MLVKMTLKIPNSGESAEQLNHSYMSGRSETHSHSRKLEVYFFKKPEPICNVIQVIEH